MTDTLCPKKLGDGSVWACALPTHGERVHLGSAAIGELGGPQLGVDELQRRARLAAIGLLATREAPR